MSQSESAWRAEVLHLQATLDRYREENSTLRAASLRLREIVTTGVTWTDKQTGEEETFCPGCGTILDDRGWLCPDGCRIAQIRKEEKC